MCPACLTTMALIAVSATSTGGVAALVAKGFHVSERRGWRADRVGFVRCVMPSRFVVEFGGRQMTKGAGPK
jgi:hypothetical protein